MQLLLRLCSKNRADVHKYCFGGFGNEYWATVARRVVVGTGTDQRYICSCYRDRS